LPSATSDAFRLPTNPRLLLQTIRGVLNLPEAGDTDPLEQIATSLSDQQFLARLVPRPLVDRR